jgi:hypothetical protein
MFARMSLIAAVLTLTACGPRHIGSPPVPVRHQPPATSIHTVP